MSTEKEPRVFETTNVDVATYLLYQGIKLLEVVKSSTKQGVAIIRFSDDKQNCLDLERIYINSDFKKFRDNNKYLLAEIHKVLKK